MHINRKIERFLLRYDLPATKFGRLSVCDPRLVLDMRRGRELGAPMIARVEAFMSDYARMAEQSLDQAA